MKSDRNTGSVSSKEAIATYVKFLEGVAEATTQAGTKRLEVFEERLLDGLACLWARGEAVTVLQAMRIDAGVSPTTVHRKLKSLRRQGMVVLEESQADNRIKFVKPTPKAERHLAQLGQCVRAACR